MNIPEPEHERHYHGKMRSSFIERTRYCKTDEIIAIVHQSQRSRQFEI